MNKQITIRWIYFLSFSIACLWPILIGEDIGDIVPDFALSFDESMMGYWILVPFLFFINTKIMSWLLGLDLGENKGDFDPLLAIKLIKRRQGLYFNSIKNKLKSWLKLPKLTFKSAINTDKKIKLWFGFLILFFLMLILNRIPLYFLSEFAKNPSVLTTKGAVYSSTGLALIWFIGALYLFLSSRIDKSLSFANVGAGIFIICVIIYSGINNFKAYKYFKPALEGRLIEQTIIDNWTVNENVYAGDTFSLFSEGFRIDIKPNSLLFNLNTKGVHSLTREVFISIDGAQMGKAYSGKNGVIFQTFKGTSKDGMISKLKKGNVLKFTVGNYYYDVSLIGFTAAYESIL
jgi:hypothetical protein